MNGAKLKYKEFCKTEKNLPIYLQDWWLNKVCGENNWDVVIVEKGGEIWGVLPFYKKKEFIFDVITMPSITQFMGPYIKYPKNLKKYSTRLGWQKKIMYELIDKLPKFDIFNQNFSFQITNWLPFFWKGFNQYTRYTYILENQSIEKIEQNFENDIRRRMKKSLNAGVKVIKKDDVKTLYELTKATFESKNEKVPYSLEFLESLFNEIKNNNSGHINLAVDENGNVLYVNLLVYDNNMVYYILGSSNPSFKDIGAIDLTLYESIKFAVDTNRDFNFVGSVIESIEKYFRSFGGKQVPYFNIYKSNSKFWKFYSFFKNKVHK
jgi:hypothetical protein